MESNFGTAKNLLLVSGLFLKERLTKIEKFYLTLVPCVALFYTYQAIFALTQRHSLGTDFNEIFAVIMFNVFPRTLIIRMNRAKFVKVLKSLENIPDFKTEKSLTLKNSLRKWLRWITLVLYPSGAIIGTIRMVTIFVGKHFNARESLNFTVVFELAYVILCHEIMMVDSVMISIMRLLHFHCKNLQQMIREIPKNARASFFKEEKRSMEIDTIPWTYLKSELNTTIYYHAEILDIIEEANEVFKFCILSTFISVSIIVGVMVHRALKIAVFTLEFLMIVCHVVFAFAVVFGECYLAESVIAESEKICEECYNIPFGGTDLRFQKSLVIVMQRCQHPTVFTIGSFGPYAIATGVTVVRACYSYIMFLENI